MTRDRSLEIWHIPKRGSIHQIIGALNIIKHFEIDGKKWPGTIRKFFDQKFAMWGFTSRGRSLSKNASETLEALIKYLGLLIIDVDRRIRITPAGHALIEEHTISEPQKKKKALKETENEIGDIHSDVIAHQMMKLVLTNPTILNYCQNIEVYPFRETILLLKDTKISYLSPEELAMFLFHMKNSNERQTVRSKIFQYRNMPANKREKLVKDYLKTPEGNLTLGQAPTSAYWRQLCINTGLCKSIKQNLYLNHDKNKEIEILLNKYEERIFNFKDNKLLWEEYYTVPTRKKQPINVQIKIKEGVSEEYLLTVLKGEHLIAGSLISGGTEFAVPVFPGETHKIKVIELKTGNEIVAENKGFDFDNRKLSIDIPETNKKKINASFYVDKIKELAKSRTFDKDYLKHLEIIGRHVGKELLDDKNRAWLRGGRLEFLFYRLLETVQSYGKITDIKWNGTVDDFGIARPAPGLRQGLPDISFKCRDRYFLLELTTIASPSAQWSAEGSSVPYHIRNYVEHTGIKDVIGVFSAPLYHQKVDDALKNTLIPYKYTIICIPIVEFADLLEKSKNLYENLMEIMEKQYSKK